MNNKKTPLLNSVKKLHIEAATSFAIENISGIDENTLQKFVELINVNGNFGSISEAELLEKMRLFRKYIPKSCGYSLHILTELLDIGFPAKTTMNGAALRTTKNEALFMAQFSQLEGLPVV